MHESLDEFEFRPDPTTDYGVGGKAASGFGADQIRTLVSMATNSTHRVVKGKRASSRFLGCFPWQRIAPIGL